MQVLRNSQVNKGWRKFDGSQRCQVHPGLTGQHAVRAQRSSKKRQTKPIEISHKSLVLKELTSNGFGPLYAKQTQFRVVEAATIGGLAMSEAGTQTITAATKIGTNPDNRFRQATSNRGSRGIRDQPRNSPTHTEKRIRISPAFPWSSRGQLPPGRVGSFRGYPLLTILLAAVKAWPTLDRVAQIGAEWDRQTRKLDNACPAGRKSGGWRVARRWQMADGGGQMADGGGPGG